MIITRSIQQNGNLDTELFEMVNSIPTNIIFNSEHNLRTPLGIYNVSSLRVFQAFKQVAKIVKENNSEYVTLSNAHKELHDSLMALIDDGYLIMKCLFPANSVKKNILFADKWLQNVDNQTKSIINQYKNDLEPFRHRLALINNRIKHNHARYCHIKITTKYEIIKGYYIEGVTSNGTITPDTEIHPIANNGEITATSYNWDIKNFFVDFYIISSLISRTIYKLIKNYHNLEISKGNINSEKNEDLFSLHEMIESIPDIFFPNEYDRNIPQIITNNKSKSVELRKNSFKSHFNRLRRYKDIKIETVFSGDGVSKSWILPYFQNQK